MRWPFRRNREPGGTGTPGATDGNPGTGGASATGASAAAVASGQPGGGAASASGFGGAAATSAGAGGAASVARATRQWAALPVMPVTISRRAPLIAGPPPVLPPLRPTAGKAPEVAPPAGTVTGIARPVAPVVEAAPTELVPPPPALPPQPVVRRAARPAPAEAPVLTDAVDEYVGTPRVAENPYRAPDWLRLAANPGQPVFPGLPGPAPTEPPSFLPPELRNPEPPAAPAQTPEPPPRMVEGVDRAETPAHRPMRPRRPNLGQSRRLGLGAPIQAPSREDLVHPEASPRVVDGSVEPAAPQEPPPPPAAPVRVTPEPEPPERQTVKPNSGPAPEKRAAVTSYRATADLLPPRKPRPAPRATVVDAVPQDLANAVRARQHVDVSNVPVYRGPKVDEAAKARGAKAFAAGGAVFLPDDAGPTDSPQARGVLAHELVHAVQQRTLGTVLPSPDSPLGQELEAEAQAAELFYGGQSGAAEPQPLIHAPQSTATAPGVEPDYHAPAQLLETPARPPAQTPPPVQSPFDPATKAEVGRIAEESARHVVTEWTNPKLEEKQNGTTGTTQTTGTTAGKPVFDRAARKEELVRQTLEVVNQERVELGKEPLTDLDATHYERIERQLDEMQSGTTPIPQTPRRPAYRPNSKEAWIHGLTGMDPNYGLGLTGFKEPVGSEKSWWGSEDERPFKERLFGAFGLGDTMASAKSDTWFEPDEDEQKTPEQQDTATRQQQQQQARQQQQQQATAAEDENPVAISRLDLDELSERLYDRIRSKLRLELLVDRERAGLSTDFR